MRPDRELHKLPVAQWTIVEAEAHLQLTFDNAFAERPDLLEPYVIRLEGTWGRERTAIMREGLRDTFAKRYPVRALRSAHGGHR